MNMIDLAEKAWLPDCLIRFGIRRLLSARLRQERLSGDLSSQTAKLVQVLKSSPIALATEQANAQHYEVPAEFFATTLGPRLKYSSCLYPDSAATLAEAEAAMLCLTCQRAELQDGMDVLDLGCGWGSLSLWIAEKYPKCQVTALSNSAGQRRFIEARAQKQALNNVRVVTANITEYTDRGSYDRILSVEMFEHMRNYEALLARIASWLRPTGKLFVHIFCHRDLAYAFNANGDDDWMARHFFTGGLMPSFDLLKHFHRDLVLRKSWQVDGKHYARTCEDWLSNLDANRAELLRLFEMPGGMATARVILQRWRIFFMACAELFGYGDGGEWFVGHYLFEPCINRSDLAENPLRSQRQNAALPERLAT